MSVFGVMGFANHPFQRRFGMARGGLAAAGRREED
jgi:hypothetical protein